MGNATINTPINEKKVNIPQALSILGCIVTIMALFAKYKGNTVIALFMSWVVIYLACAILGIDWNSTFKSALDGIHSAFGAFIILIFVGAVIGTWIPAGTIGYVINQGLGMINPKFFLLCTLIICSIMSIFTGTSTGSVASAGVAMMGIGTVLGFPIGPTAGAAMCGSLFGDKMSPLSDTTNVAPALTGGNLFKHIRAMLYTTIIPYIFCLIFFTVLGFRYTNNISTNLSDIEVATSILNANFKLSIICLLPLALVIVLLVLKVDVIPALGASAISGVLIAWLYQGRGLIETFNMMYSGFTIRSGNEIVDRLLIRGGMVSMSTTVFVMIFAIGMGTMLEKLGVISALVRPFIDKLDSTIKLICMAVGVTYGAAALTTTMTGTAVISARVMSPVFKTKGLAPEMLSRTIEDCGTLGGALIPWHIVAVVFGEFLGASWSQFVLFLPLCYLAPIMAIVCAVTGWGIWYVDEDGNPIKKEEHKKLYPNAFK